jgi:hypothetical protein
MLPRVTDREELIAVVQRIIDMRYSEEEMPDILELLVRSTGCPDVSDLIYWPKRPMTSVEIVDTALAHRPIILGDAR